MIFGSLIITTNKMIIQKKKKNTQEGEKELKEHNGIFELTKPQINKGNVLNIQHGNTKISIRL